MRVRSRMLPAGWYPTSQSRCLQEIETYVAGVSPLAMDTRVYGGMVPHAGWYFSGKLAARVFFLASRANQPQVVCIFGGHLPPDAPALLATEDAWETPLGDLPLATECFQPLRRSLKLQEDVPGDNTIEIQLPFVKHFFPQAKLLALRAPHSPEALQLGEAVVAVAQELKLSLLTFGSSDLTHYGPNYGWAPKGFGLDAVKWVKEVNDKRFLDLALKLDGAGFLTAAAEDQCACSPGGATASVAAAKKAGATKSLLVDYYTSYDIMPGDSFVGYGGLIWAG